MGRYKAVIFDLDGTLVDSLEDIADAMNEVLSRQGYPVHGYQAYNYFVGNGMKTLVARCLPDAGRSEADVERSLKMLMERYGAHYADKTRLYDGIPELLDSLTARGISMAVLSNKADELTQKICAHLFSRWEFKVIMGATERFPRKPDPASALWIASQMGATPTQVLYVGDTDTDMQTARAAGMTSVGVTWGFRDRQELEHNGAAAVIDSPGELLACIE